MSISSILQPNYLNLYSQSLTVASEGVTGPASSSVLFVGQTGYSSGYTGATGTNYPVGNHADALIPVTIGGVRYAIPAYTAH